MRCLLFVLGWTLSATAVAASPQDLQTLRDQAANHLLSLAGGACQACTAEVEVDRADPRLRLPACAALRFFLAPGSNPWGSGILGASCESPAPWSLYFTYRIRLRGPALVARHPLPARQAMSGNDVRLEHVELAGDPGQYPRDPARVAGAVLSRPVTAGSPISIDMLRRQPLIRAGQRVRILVDGQGFLVSQEGIAQQQASVGETVRLKTPSGRIVQGIVQPDASVRIRP